MSMIYRNVDRYAKWTKKEMDKKIVNLFSPNPDLTLHRGQAKLKQKGLDIIYRTKLFEYLYLSRATSYLTYRIYV